MKAVSVHQVGAKCVLMVGFDAKHLREAEDFVAVAQFVENVAADSGPEVVRQARVIHRMADATLENALERAREEREREPAPDATANVETILHLSKRLTDMMLDPHPGLATWVMAANKLLGELAVFAPPGERTR